MQFLITALLLEIQLPRSLESDSQIELGPVAFPLNCIPVCVLGWLWFNDTGLVSLSMTIAVVFWKCKDDESERSCEIGVVLGVTEVF